MILVICHTILQSFLQFDSTLQRIILFEFYFIVKAENLTQRIEIVTEIKLIKGTQVKNMHNFDRYIRPAARKYGPRPGPQHRPGPARMQLWIVLGTSSRN